MNDSLQMQYMWIVTVQYMCIVDPICKLWKILTEYKEGRENSMTKFYIITEDPYSQSLTSLVCKKCVPMKTAANGLPTLNSCQYVECRVPIQLVL